MAHKLGGLKRIFRVDFSGRDPVLVERGELDVSGMSPTGTLSSGSHTPRGGRRLDITGRAYIHQGETFFTFSHTTAPGTFFGKLMVDSRGKLMLTGTFSVETARTSKSRKTKKLLNQEEEPWVITKP